MKVNITKAGTYSITGLTRTDYRTIGYILRIADDRCFGEQDEDFVCSLDEKEREALRKICSAL